MHYCNNIKHAKLMRTRSQNNARVFVSAVFATRRVTRQGKANQCRRRINLLCKKVILLRKAANQSQQKQFTQALPVNANTCKGKVCKAHHLPIFHMSRRKHYLFISNNINNSKCTNRRKLKQSILILSS